VLKVKTVIQVIRFLIRRSEFTRGDSNAQKKVNFSPSSSNIVNKQLIPQQSQYQSNPQDGQFEDDEYTDYDDGDEYFEQLETTV
jgi:hypothetical protein